MELLIVLGRLAFSAFANVFQKTLAHHGLPPLFIVFSSYLVLAALSLPLLSLIHPLSLNSAFWLNILLAAGLDMAGTLFLVMSLSQTDLSVFGPLNAYKVVISMLLAMVFLGEIPSVQGFIGVAIIVAGSYALFPPASHQGRLLSLFAQKGVQYRFLSIVLFSIGTLPLKTAVSAGGSLAATLFWCLFGLPLAALVQALFMRQNGQSVHHITGQERRYILYLGCLIWLMQYMTMLVFEQLFIAYSLALFQLSMVLQVFLGYRIFREKHIARRLIACLIMMVGSLLVLNA